MDLKAVAFPALLVADDGWVEYLHDKSQLSVWTTSAIRKYSKRRVLIYDVQEHAWLVENIVPEQNRHALLKLVDAIRNPRIAIKVGVRPLETPAESVRDALLTAIGVDDDALTQFVEVSELKRQIQNANSFNAFVQVLRSARAIDV